MRRLITLTTDFGLQDHYTGVMKGVIYSINPDVKIVDISHNVPAHDILRAALMLRNSYAFFREGTIHIVVVDPGVGGKRIPIVVEASGQLFIGPDNGVFSCIYEEDPGFRARKIENPLLMLKAVSHTFHGRDVFAPAAAHFSKGFRVEDAGSVVETPVKLQIPKPEATANTIRGCVLYADGFGNLITNIPSHLAVRARKILISGVSIDGVSKSYDEVERGELLAIIGSSSFLEISVNRGSAAKRLNLEGKSGEEVLVEILL